MFFIMRRFILKKKFLYLGYKNLILLDMNLLIELGQQHLKLMLYKKVKNKKLKMQKKIHLIILKLWWRTLLKLIKKSLNYQKLKLKKIIKKVCWSLNKFLKLLLKAKKKTKKIKNGIFLLRIKKLKVNRKWKKLWIS